MEHLYKLMMHYYWSTEGIPMCRHHGHYRS